MFECISEAFKFITRQFKFKSKSKLKVKNNEHEKSPEYIQKTAKAKPKATLKKGSGKKHRENSSKRVSKSNKNRIIADETSKSVDSADDFYSYYRTPAKTQGNQFLHDPCNSTGVNSVENKPIEPKTDSHVLDKKASILKLESSEGDLHNEQLSDYAISKDIQMKMMEYLKDNSNNGE